MKFLKPTRSELDNMKLGETRVFGCTSNFATGTAASLKPKKFSIRTVILSDMKEGVCTKLQAITYAHNQADD